MGQIIRSPFAIETFTGAGDITTSGGYLLIAGLTPNLYYNGAGAKATLQKSLYSTPNVVVVTPTAVASTVYRFTITQLNLETNSLETYVFQANNPAAGGTATTICDQFKNQIRGSNSVTGGGSLDVTVDANGAGTMTITGRSINPLFTVGGISPSASLAQASGLAMTPTIASCTAATPTVATWSAAHGLITGQVITIVSADNTKLASGTYRVIVASSTTTTFETTTGQAQITATATTTATATKVAQTPQGQYSQVVATPFLAGGTPVSGNTYSTLTWNGTNPDAPLNISPNPFVMYQAVYFDEGTLGSATVAPVATTNFAAMFAQLVTTLGTINVL